MRSTIAFGIVVAVAAQLSPIVRSASAVVLCQNKRNPKAVVLRTKCTKRETTAIDLSTVLGDQGHALTDQGNALADAERQLGRLCVGDPGRKLVASKFSGGTARGAFRERAGGGCRSLGTDQAACDASFQNDDLFTSHDEAPAASCFFLHHACYPCLNRVVAHGACHNTCEGPLPTCADATRTTFAGGPDGDACARFKTQPDCEKAFHVGGIDNGHRVASCWWNATKCQGCGPRNLNAAKCTNTCDPAAAKATCKDAGRTLYAGGPENDACTTYNGDQANCDLAWHEGAEGVAATCWYDGTKCRGCGRRYELTGRCSNSCI
jgi:hypothetical protein